MISRRAQLTRCFPLFAHMLFLTFILHAVSHVLSTILIARGLNLNAACTPVRQSEKIALLPKKSVPAATLLLNRIK